MPRRRCLPLSLSVLLRKNVFCEGGQSVRPSVRGERAPLTAAADADVAGAAAGAGTICKLPLSSLPLSVLDVAEIDLAGLA